MLVGGPWQCSKQVILEKEIESCTQIFYKTFQNHVKTITLWTKC